MKVDTTFYFLGSLPNDMSLNCFCIWWNAFVYENTFLNQVYESFRKKTNTLRDGLVVIVIKLTIVVSQGPVRQYKVLTACRVHFINSLYI